MIRADGRSECEASGRDLDLLAWNYYAIFHLPVGYGARVRRDRVLEVLTPGSGTLLDVGCGPGLMVEETLKRGYTFWGVDASETILAECQRKFGRLSGAQFRHGNALELEFPDTSFDVVLCLGVIDHIADWESAIREMARVLREGGTLIISFPNRYSPYAAWRYYVFYRGLAWLRARLRHWPGRGRPLFPNRSMRTEHEARVALSRHVGRVERVVYFNFSILLSPLDELFPRFAVWLARRMEPLRNRRMRWLGAGFIVKACKTLQ